MATKTISLKLEAYERLRAARRAPDESFSQVVLRAEWPVTRIRADDFLARCREQKPILPPEALNRIEELDQGDRPPKDKWTSR